MKSSSPRRSSRSLTPGTLIAALAAIGCQPGTMVSDRPGDHGHGAAADARPVETVRKDGGAAAAPDGPPSQPTGWADAVKPREAVDLNPDPRVVEVKIEARVAEVELRPGVKTAAWTYDGGVPGPLIRVRKGDRLIVHFTNRLPAETTVHWHGLRIPAPMDGVPGHSQPPVKTGGRFDYDFVVPDAGLYWYHPHIRSAAQTGDGLYGAILVEDPDEPKGLGDEIPLVLSDISLDEGGHLSDHTLGGDVATLFGREGNVLLVNGRSKPVLEARAGVRQRWRIVNSARSRYFQLALAGHTFLRIGGDGGLVATPVESERIVLTPGERADVLVVPRGEPGTSVPLRWVAFDRGYGTAFMRPDETVLTVRFANAPAVAPTPLPQIGRNIPPLDLRGATAVDIALTQNNVNGKFFLGVNGKPFGGDEHLHAKVHETQIWTISNPIAWDHPFHLHGFFFQVLDDAGKPVEPIEWKDTVNVPVKKKVRLAVKYDDRVGPWMFHCHILDHADAGMMGMVMLEK